MSGAAYVLLFIRGRQPHCINTYRMAIVAHKWLQWEFDTLMGLFCGVVLQKNVGKMFVIVCYIYHTICRHSDAVYTQRMTGEG